MDKVLIGDQGFNKVDEVTNPELVSKQTLVTLTNMVLDKDGYALKPYKRGGITQFNENVYDSANNARSIHDVKDSADTNYLLASVSTKLKKSASGTGAWSDVKTGLTANLRMRLVSYLDRQICTNGTDKPFVLSDSAFGTVNNLELNRPDIQGMTLTASSGGSLDPLSKYAYCIVYRTSYGERSDYSCPMYIEIQNTGDYTVTLANIPVPSDSRITSKEIYRTEGNGLIYYLLATLDVDTTSFEDDAADTELQTSQVAYIYSTPVKIKYLCVHKERIIVGNYSILTTDLVQKPFNNWATEPNDIGSGVLPAGTYKYKYSYLYKDGTESILSPYFGITVATGTSKINLATPYAFIGAARFEKNTDIIGARVYRTTNGGSTYYWVGDITTSVLNDETLDGALTDQYPKSGQATNIDFKSSIYMSDIGLPSQWNNLYQFPIYEDDNDAVTGIFDDENGILIFKENSICYKSSATGSDPVNWISRKLIDGIGATSDIICKNGNEYLFMYHNRPYLYSVGGQPKPIGFTRQPTFDNISAYRACTYWQTKGWYILSVTFLNVNNLLCYDTKLETWYRFTIPANMTCYDLLIKKFGNNAGIFLQAGSLFVMSYDEDSEVDQPLGIDAEIQTEFKTGIIKFYDGIKKGYPRVLRNVYNKRASQSISIVIMDKIDETKFNTITDSTGSGLKNIKLDAFGGTLEKPEKVDLRYYGYGLSYFDMARLEYEEVDEGTNVGS